MQQARRTLPGNCGWRADLREERSIDVKKSCVDPRNERLLPCRAACAVFAPAAAPHVNPQALDLLIQRGKRDQETLRGFRLIPAAPLEHIHDDAPFDFVDDLEQRRVRMIRRGAGTWLARQWRQKLGELKTDTADDLLAANRIGQQIDV